MKKIILLGASGSIGQQSLDILRSHKDEFKLVAASVGERISVVHDMVKEFPVTSICVLRQEDAYALKQLYPSLQITHGEQGLVDLINSVEADIAINGIVGFAGLIPTITAIRKDMDVALANKESLVIGGELIARELKQHRVHLIPVDSEHSAIFQCLNGVNRCEVNKLILTASGGSFRNKTREQLKNVTVLEALNHPNWQMGNKITIDSATFMNKGFEVIEAHYLFNMDYDDIEVLIHPQSIVHSMIQTVDGAILAQFGTPDMRLPIQYALTYPQRLAIVDSKRLSLNQVSLDFSEPDIERFPLLDVAYACGRKAGNSGAILNAANEVAVNAFLNGKIDFLEIERLILKALDCIEYKQECELIDLVEADRLTREYVLGILKGGF